MDEISERKISDRILPGPSDLSCFRTTVPFVRFCFSPLAPRASRFTIENDAMLYALCSIRDVEVTMPAIASLEDLKASQKEGLTSQPIGSKEWYKPSMACHSQEKA